MKACVIEVALQVPCMHTFKYLWPWPNIQPLCGIRVQVPFGRHHRIGIVVSVAADHSTNMSLKTVKLAIDSAPLVLQPILEVLKWASEYYHAPIGEVVHQALPPMLRGTDHVLEKQISQYWLTLCDKSTRPKKLSNAAKQLFTYMQEVPQGCLAMHLHYQGITMRTIQAAIKKGWLRNNQMPAESTLPTLALNASQDAVANYITAASGFNVHYIEGVTGSGKTYVYAALMRQCMAKAQQALMLVPEIGLTGQTVLKLQHLCGSKFVCVHSQLSPSARLQAWQQVQQLDAAWVVGTRSALFLPWQKLGLIIVDEAHDTSFKQQSGWRYSARDMAVVLAKQYNIPVVLGSATPSLESLYNIQKERFQHYQLMQRYAQAVDPAMELVDMRGCKAPLAPAVCEAIQTTIDQQQQVLIFLNRRGFSPVLFCTQCRWVAECHQCDARMVQHHAPAKLICHQCGSQRPIPTVCGHCNNDSLLPIGFGSQRLEAWLSERFKANILRIDRDQVKNKNQLDKALNAVAQEQYNILVGTQMLAKGHHWPKLTLVVMVDADMDLYSPDFRAFERFAQLLVQVSGRAGRAQWPGRVLIQTHWPEHKKFTQLCQQGYRGFALQLLKERQVAGLPPYHAMAVLLVQGTRQKPLIEALHQAKQVVKKQHFQGLQITGPLPTWVSQVAGRFRMQLIFTAPKKTTLHRALNLLHSQPCLKNISWQIDVDPQS